MADGVLSRWIAVRQMVTLYAEEAGYISLQTYYTDRSGEQVGRFDVSPTSLARWAPAVETEGSIDLDLGTVKPIEDDGYSEDAEEVGPLDEEDAEGDAEEDDAPEGGDDAEEAEAEADADAIDPIVLLSATRAWLYSTAEDNTPAGEKQRFRIRIHSLKGAKQLWSSILDYESGKPKPSEPREPRKPIELTSYERKPVSEEEDDAPQEVAFTGSPEERVLSEEEIAFSELLMNSHEEDDLLDFSDEIPRSATAATDNYDFITTPEPEVATRRTIRRKRAPTVPKGAPSQAIQSLMHLHKSHKEFIDTVMATTKQLVKVQAGAMEQLSGGLGDARTRENDLIQVIQGLRLAEAESAVEAAKAQDASEVRSVLGKEAISQMGLLGQVLLTRKSPQTAAPIAPTNGVPQNGVPQNGAHIAAHQPPPELVAPPANGAHLYPDVSSGALLAVGEPSEQQMEEHEHSMVSLLGWAESRPDVLEALNDPSVRAYLRNSENVDQLRGLAQMMSPASEGLPPADFPVENTPADEAVETQSEDDSSDDAL